MNVKNLVLSISLFVGAANAVLAKDVLRCEREPDNYNEYTRTQLIISRSDFGAYTYYASRCKGSHGSHCLAEIGDYESFGDIDAAGGNFRNQDITVVQICGGIRAYFDQRENIYFDFEASDCESL